MDSTGCVMCGSDRVIRDARVNDRAEDNVAWTLHLRVGYSHPGALLFKGPLDVEVRADVCGSCGHVALRVADPAAMWHAYTRLPAQPAP